MQLTFSGCIYANPAKNDQEAGPRDLTINELQQMKLTGLPVRVEHGSRARVGTIKGSRTDAATGYTSVDMEFDDSVEGHVAAALIEKGTIRELSLCHDVYADNTKIPVEVSLVQEGARPNTIIFPDMVSHDDAFKQYISRRVSASIRAFNQPRDPHGRFTYTIMSSEASAPVQTETPAAVAAPAVAAPVAVPAPAPVQTEAAGDEPPAKRQAVAADSVEKIARSLNEADRALYYETLANAFELRNEAVKKEAESRARAEAIEREKLELAAKYDATKTNTNSMARQLAYVLDDMYRKFTPGEAIKNDEEAKKITEGILDMSERHPLAYQHLAKLQVACSKMLEKENEYQKLMADQHAREAESIRFQSEKQRQRFLDMSGTKVDAPAVPVNAAPANPWMTVQAPVTVAASVHGLPSAPAAAPAQAARGGFVLPDFIRQNCNGMTGDNRVYSRDIYSVSRP